MKTLFEKIDSKLNLYDELTEEKSGIELLEELANSHCKECGCSLESDPSKSSDEYCKECFDKMYYEDIAFQSQREK